MAVTWHKESRTIRGITYNYGDSFKCYAENKGAVTSEGSGSASALTKGTTYYYQGYATGDSNNITHPYAVSNSKDSAIRGWYKDNVFPYATYTIKYNANGGKNAPGSQTKTYGTATNLSSLMPTKDGYTFTGWNTKADGTGTSYAAGASYGTNAAVTLYAQWTAKTYTITYNANGGTLGSVKTQSKTHGKTLTLTGTATRTNYTLKGWSISASATAATYSVGGSYTENKAVTLYAVWELAYTKPRITIVSLGRAKKNADGTFAVADEGGYIQAHFIAECDGTDPVVTFSRKATTETEWTTTKEYSISTNIVEEWTFGAGQIDPEKTYEIIITVKDSGGSYSKSAVIPSIEFPIDALPKSSESEKSGVAFGKAAELPGVADFAYDAKFNKPVYGKALGMDKLPAIPSNSDLNNYMETGCYAVQSNAIAETCGNIPVTRAGRLEVWSATGEGVRAAQWSYLRQRYIPYNSSNAVWERDITRNADNVWTYYDWWQSSLTPEASEKVYSKAAMTVALSANTVLGAVNTYTKIPFDKAVLSTNSRLTLSSNAIRIGTNIQHIKVSGQVLVSPGSTDGLRHVRIQKVSGSTTTSVAWSTLYFTGSRHALHVLTPLIVSVKEGDLLQMVFYTGNSSDSISSGTSAYGWQTFLTVEEL